MRLSSGGDLHTRVRLKRWLVAPLILLLVAGIVAGILTGTFTALARGGLYATGLWTDGGASTVPPGTFDRPAVPATPKPEPAGVPPAVLAVAKAAPRPNAARVAARVNAVDGTAMGGSFGGSVLDAGTGAALYSKNARSAYIPASTMKLLTATTALTILGPRHQFTTKVVHSGANRVILVGGGDPYLGKVSTAAWPARTSLPILAQQTANELKRTRQTTVALGYDGSLFSGPAWHPDWPSTYRDQVTPVSALWVNEGRRFRSPGPRVPDPAKSAAQEFARELARQGIRVTQISSAAAPKGARQLAAVKSVPLESIVEQLLKVSDNDAAEVLLRQAAIGAGQPGSFTSGRAVVQTTLSTLGVWHTGAQIRDGSGLSRNTKVPSDTMVKVLRLSLSAGHPELRAVATGLSVAGVEGSLRPRFFDAQSRAGRGLVRGKTGTLTKVQALAGYVRSTDGSLLVYAFLVNNPKNPYAARVWLDRVSTALATCGCR